MRIALVVALGLVPGCSTIFGLETPRALADAAAVDDAGPDAPDDSGPVDMMTDAPIACPLTYTTTIGTSKYRASVQNRGFPEAAADCAGDGTNTHLAVITSQTELANVLVLVSFHAWIGLSDRVTAGTLIWVTNEDGGGYPPADGMPWGTGEPAFGSTKHCVLTREDGEWSIESCGLNRPYICECDAFANDATRY